MLRDRGHLSSIMAVSSEVAAELKVAIEVVFEASSRMDAAVTSFPEAAKAWLQTDHTGDLRRHYCRVFRQIQELLGTRIDRAIEEMENTPQVLEELATPPGPLPKHPQPRGRPLRYCPSSLPGFNTSTPSRSRSRSPIRRKRANGN